MKTSGIDDLKAVLRRSAWIVVTLIVVGAVAMTLLKQSQGPRYSASSQVVLSPTDLAASLTGIQPTYVDPARQDEAERNLASAPQLYAFASAATSGRYGSGAHMQSVTSVSASNNVVSFSAVTKNASDAVRIVNAVADAYPRWRVTVYARTIQVAISQVRAQLKGGSAGNATLNGQLQKLELLKTVNSGDTLYTVPADGAAKVSPRPYRDAALGGAIGLVIAFLMVGLRELLDTRVRSEADVEESLGVPVIGTVQTLPRRARGGLAALRESKYTETYELLAANLVRLIGEHDGATRLAVTSAIAGEGKTTTAANLAAALARRGTNVVLADFDLRKPALAALFAIPNGSVGVTEILKGSADLQSALWRMRLKGDAQRGNVTKPESADRRSKAAADDRTAKVAGPGSLTVLPAGKPSANGSGALFSQLPGLLNQLMSNADVVIVDTPPVLMAAGVAELSQSLDAVLVVVRQGAVTQRRLRALGRQAQTWRSSLIGAVLNDAPREAGYRHYYSEGS